MKFQPKAIMEVVKETFKEFGEDKAPRLGAALAYYTIFSIAPLLLITITIVGVVFHKEASEGLIADQLSHLIGQQGAEAVQSMVKGAGDKKNTGIVASIIGFAVLLFGASGVFVQLKDALNTIWDVPTAEIKGGMKGFIRTRFLSFGLVLAVGFLLLVSLVISVALSGVEKFLDGMQFLAPVLGVVNFAISFGVITGLFALIFKFLPDIEIRWKDVWMGAALTSLLFTIGKSLIGMYLGKSSVTSSYGAAGSLVVLLIWVYYSAQILFFGAELTQVYTRRFGSHTGSEIDKAGQGSAAGTRESHEGHAVDRSRKHEKSIQHHEAIASQKRSDVLKAATPVMPALATRPNAAVEKMAQGLAYGLLALLKLDTARRAVGLAPMPEDPIALGGAAQSSPRREVALARNT